MPLEIKKCDKCGNEFKQRCAKQRFCQNPCSMATRQSIEEQNKYWAEKVKLRTGNRDLKKPAFTFKNKKGTQQVYL